MLEYAPNTSDPSGYFDRYFDYLGSSNGGYFVFKERQVCGPELFVSEHFRVLCSKLLDRFDSLVFLLDSESLVSEESWGSNRFRRGWCPIPVGSLHYFQAYLWAATLPIIVLTFISFGGYMLIMRNTMNDILTEDYIMMARAKGLSERAVLYKHAFRNALLPLITTVAIAFGFILSGAIITETIFQLHRSRMGFHNFHNGKRLPGHARAILPNRGNGSPRQFHCRHCVRIS